MPKLDLYIERDLNRYIRKHGNNFRKWFIGISSDPEKSLFKEHNVDKCDEHWIYILASSNEVAKKIKNSFIKAKNLEGVSERGDRNSRYIYAYKITDGTKQLTN